MTVINHKSISGITSITAPAGSDNLFTVHTNDTTERFRIDASGHQNISGIITAANFKTGTSNVHSTGYECTNVNATGIVTAANISIEDDIIHTGDTNTMIRFPAADTVTVETAGTERLRIESNGDVEWNNVGTPTPGEGNNTVGMGFEPRNGTIFLSRGSNALIISNRNNDGRHIHFNQGGTGKFAIGLQNSGADLAFFSGAGNSPTEKFRIGSDGTLTLKNNSNMMIDLQSSAGTGSAWIEFSDTDGTRKGYFGYGSSGSEKVYWVQSKAAEMSMYSNGNDRFVVQSNGNKVVKNGRLNILSTFIDFSGSISTPSTAAAIYRPADNTLAVSTANTEKIKIDGSGVLWHTPSGNYDNAYLKGENTSTTYLLKTQKNGAVDTNMSFNVQDGGTLKTLLYLRGENKTVAIGPNITPARNLHVQEHILVGNIGTNSLQPYVSSTPLLAVCTDGQNLVPSDSTYRHNALVSFGVGGHNAGNPGSNACPGLGYFKLDLYGQTGLGDVGTNLDSTLSIRSINPNTTRLRIRTKDNYNGTYPDAIISFTQQQGTEIARIHCDTETAAANRADLVFYTNYGGLYERLRIKDTGTLIASANSGMDGTNVNYHQINNSQAYTWCLNVRNHSSGYGIRVKTQSNSSGREGYYLWDNANSQGMAAIYMNGTYDSRNNDYGAFSDIKLKENIVDATSQWDDVKAIKFRNFNFKKDDPSKKMLGVIAQELESISPGLIEDIPDKEENSEGNMVETGEVTKHVRYSVLYMKAIKALQEAMIKIETLEAKVAALESS